MVTTQGLKRSAATTFFTPCVVGFVLVVFLGVFLSLTESSPAGVRDGYKEELTTSTSTTTTPTITASKTTANQTPSSTITSTTIEYTDKGTLWPETNPNKYCEGFEQLDTVANQQECQIQCLWDDDCIGILYSHVYANLCYKCSEADVLVDDPNGYGFYAKTAATLVASDGTVFERAKTNAECCLTQNILKSEDGTESRWPLLYFTEGTFKCHGGIKKTYQEWIDFCSTFPVYDGICFEGWGYFRTVTTETTPITEDYSTFEPDIADFIEKSRTETSCGAHCNSQNRTILKGLCNSADYCFYEEETEPCPLDFGFRKRCLDLKKDILEAARKGEVERVTRTLDKAKELNIFSEVLNSQDETGRSALHLAIKKEKEDVANILLDLGCDVNTSVNEKGGSSEGYTPLIRASYYGWTDIVKKMIKNGALVNAMAKGKVDAAYYAAYKGHLETLKVLLEKDPSVADRQGFNGRTPLITATLYGHLDIVKYLVQNNNPRINSIVHDWTPLMLAVFYNHPQIVDFLLNKGADPSIKDIEGNTALELAIESENTEVIKIIKKYVEK